jgi:hypothetical protein
MALIGEGGVPGSLKITGGVGSNWAFFLYLLLIMSIERANISTVRAVI